MESLKLQRWISIVAAILITGVLGFLSAALTEWVGKLSEIEYPAEEFGLDVTYPDGFWLDGILLFFGVTIAGSLLSLCARKAVVTVDGYQSPTGSKRLQILAHLITGLGVACSSLNPALGPLVFVVGLACLVVSIQQKCPDHSHLLES